MTPSEALAAHRVELRELVSRHGFAGASVYPAMGVDADDDNFYLLVDTGEDTILSKLIQLERAATGLLGLQTVLNTPSLLLEEFRDNVMGMAQPL